MPNPVVAPKGPYLHVYLADMKGKWTSYCRRHGEKPGAAVKKIIAALISREGGPFPEVLEVPEEIDPSRGRIELRLTASERTKLNELAELQGLTVNRYIVNLARAHLLRKPQFSIQELEALTESNAQLLALGRNLNQIARALNAEDPDEHRPTVESIKALRDQIQQHTKHIRRLIDANLDRWRIK